MKKENLIQKWLANELSEKELEAFKQLDEAGDYQKISESAKHFKAPEFDREQQYASLQTNLKRSERTTLTSTLLKIAAVFVIGFGVYFGFFSNSETTVKTLAGTTETISLPDGSKVALNDASTLRFDHNDFDQERIVYLKGEAFFKVAKGETFKVVTKTGTIQVLGTQFNVKQRDNYFEVTCYEGLVSVKTATTKTLLKAGKSVRYTGKKANLASTKRDFPSWTNGVSSFNSVPFKEVAAEFERQYQLEIRLKNRTFDTDRLFTGSFVHHDLETALQSITVPFNLVYTVKGDTVILKVREP